MSDKKEEKVWRLDIELDFIPYDEKELEKLQWVLSDSISAIASNYGRVARLGRGWRPIE